MVLPFSDFTNFIKNEKPIGIFVDTSILFAASYTPDIFNAESELLFDVLATQKVPPFVSVNVRTEFLENHRRIGIADSLVDFLEDLAEHLPGPTLLKLQTHKKIHKSNVDEGKPNKIDNHQIKVFRQLLKNFSWDDKNGWEILCSRYLKPQIIKEWNKTENNLALNFISTRSTDQSPLLERMPSWDDAVNLIGDHGLGSSDAMILNMFLCSKLPALLTADIELALCADKEAQSTKQVFVPDILFKEFKN